MYKAKVKGICRVGMQVIDLETATQAQLELIWKAEEAISNVHQAVEKTTKEK